MNAHLDQDGAPGEGWPVGTVTFLFADVEGSTQALEREGEAYAHLLGRFRLDSEALVVQSGGTLVQTEGDGVFAVFSTAQAAVQTAVDAQRMYLAYPVPGPLRVRIGLHSGTGALVGGTYAGVDVHRAARVAAAAHGGQILVTAATRELIRDRGDSLADLGWFELKGLTRPEHLLQLSARGLPDAFPPVRAQPSARADLPRHLTPLVGRDADIEAVDALLERGTRLLTLTGPGGIGKTRLAVAVAERVASRYADGVAFVELASVTDVDRVAEMVAARLGRTIEGSLSAEDTLVDELQDRQLLLVLDNLEQVVGGAALLDRLLARLPRLQMLVTSRIALRLSAEREHEVAPLSLPGSPDPGDVSASAAVRLLIERAQAVRPGFAVTPGNAGALAELVRRLDGIPLAIELAASRLRLLEPIEMVARLRSALDLTAAAIDMPDRQRTLRAAIDWSFHLLAPPERTLLGRLGAFVDGWTLEAAEAVAGGPEIGDLAVALDMLAAHSLVRLETPPASGARTRLLGPIYEYALTLVDGADRAALLDRHAAYFASWVEGYPRGAGEGLSEWQRRVDLEWGNIRQAIGWCADRADHPRVARFLAALWPHLWIENRVVEARAWLEGLRPHVDDLPPRLRGEIVHVDGFFALEVGDYQHALDWGRRALREAEAEGDEELAGRSRLLVAGTLPAFDLRDPAILGLLDGAIAAFRARGDVVNLAYALNFLCSYRAAIGDVGAAREAIEEALVLSEDLGAVPLRAQSWLALAFVDLISGDLDAAEDRLGRALEALASTPSREVLTYVLDGYGWWALAGGQVVAGLTAIGAAEGLRARLGLRAWPLAAAQVALLGRLADSFDDPSAQAARRSGRHLTADEALAAVAGAR